jgi:hypothetical protein
VQEKCDVCVLVDGDHRIKEVNYCGRCDANICSECQPNTIKRAEAMLRRKAQDFIHGHSSRLFGSKSKSNQLP